MIHSQLNDQTNEDVFFLDRDQQQQPRQRPSTPPPNYRLINPARRPTIYEIIRTEDQHFVLVHDNQTPQTINDEDENRAIRRFTTENLVIPDDVFMSPISKTDSSSEGYWTCSSSASSSSWRSYDSVRDDLPTLFDTPIRSISQFLLPEGTGQRSRGLSQPHLSCEFCSKYNPVFGEWIRKWTKRRTKTNNKQTFSLIHLTWNNGAKKYKMWNTWMNKYYYIY